ncbi:hypothetical protein C4B60_14815 [Jeotgalibacillus proteolyticus]|uniref:Uncharacterized protein n=1 Tax=Jeotgalibacillus proteolyticus TaxID=2082395 RepID=A0A2S5GA61_9BACL|nr:hypothetical protein C4B60_14815 [Jeotgalibacillus proteolyticus]
MSELNERLTLLRYPAPTGSSSDRKSSPHLGKKRLIGGSSYVCRSYTPVSAFTLSSSSRQGLEVTSQALTEGKEQPSVSARLVLVAPKRLLPLLL